MNDAWWKVILSSLIFVLSFTQIDSENSRNSFDPSKMDVVKQAELGYPIQMDFSEIDELDTAWVEEYFGDLIEAYKNGYLLKPVDSLTATWWLRQIRDDSKDIDVESVHDSMVERFIRYFQTERGKRFIAKSLKRGIYYSPLTLEVILRSGMPEELFFLPIIESGYRPKARSRAGAKGIWQFMRSTGRKYGLKIIRYRVDERLDPQRSAEAAMTYLKDLYDTLGRWDLAIAAYNAGEAKVFKAIQKYRYEHPEDTLITFWDIKDKLPRETRRYVPQFYALLKIMNHPEIYGFDEVFDTLYCERMEFETISISGPTDMRKIARIVGIPLYKLRKLNPHILSNRIPSRARNIVLRMPPGSVEALLSIPGSSRS